MKILIFLGITLSVFATTANQILSVPQNEETFENTLRAWFSLIEENTSALSDQELTNKVTSYAYKAIHSSIPYQQKMAKNFFDKKPIISIQTSATSPSSLEDLLILQSSSSKDLLLLTKKILVQNADIVCLKDISEETAHTLYERLKQKYAHFYIGNPLMEEKGLFIASKHPMAGIHVTNKILDFVVQNAHIYTSFDKTTLEKLPQESNLFLCGHLHNLQKSSQVDIAFIEQNMILSIVKNLGPRRELFVRESSDGAKVVLCEGKEKIHGEISADNQGNQRFNAEFQYYNQNPNGLKSTSGLGIEYYKNKYGDKKGGYAFQEFSGEKFKTYVKGSYNKEHNGKSNKEVTVGLDVDY